MLRKFLIVGQFTAAIVLIISTMVIYKQINYIKNKDLGFKRDQIITFRNSRELRPKLASMKKELLMNNHIRSVTAASSIPLRIRNTNPVYWEGQTAKQYTPMKFVCVDYDYFETFDMKMAFGRSFSRNHPTDRRNYIINEAALKLTGFKNPVGKMFSMWTAEGQIVGVVRDFHNTSLHNEIRPIVFVMYNNMPYSYSFIKVNPVDLPATLKFIEQKVKNFAPEIPFNYQFLDEIFQKQYLREDRIAGIMKYFTLLAILIACLGLFGLAAFMAARRAREVAIRKVLGAPLMTILRLLSKEFLWLVAIANVIAWPLAFYLMRDWLQNFAFHTRIGWPAFIIAGVVGVVVAMITIAYQTFRAAIANPVDRLRNE